MSDEKKEDKAADKALVKGFSIPPQNDAERRDELIRKARAYVDANYGGSWLDCFGDYDEDDDGLLGVGDVRAFCRDIGVGNAMTRGWWVSGIFHALDTNRDGSISARNSNSHSEESDMGKAKLKAIVDDVAGAAVGSRPLERIREAVFCRRVRQHTADELQKNGFALVKDDLAALGVTPPVHTVEGGAYTPEAVAEMFAKAEAAGQLSDEVILAASVQAGLKLPAVGKVGGAIGDFFRKIIEWLSDPANREKLLAVVKFLLMLLSLFAI